MTSQSVFLLTVGGAQVAFATRMSTCRKEGQKFEKVFGIAPKLDGHATILETHLNLFKSFFNRGIDKFQA